MDNPHFVAADQLNREQAKELVRCQRRGQLPPKVRRANERRAKKDAEAAQKEEAQQKELPATGSLQFNQETV